MKEQPFVVAIRLPGHARYVIHGPFPSYEQARVWLIDIKLLDPVPPVQWRILPMLSPDDPTVVWRTQMEALAYEDKK